MIVYCKEEILRKGKAIYILSEKLKFCAPEHPSNVSKSYENHRILQLRQYCVYLEIFFGQCCSEMWSLLSRLWKKVWKLSFPGHVHFIVSIFNIILVWTWINVNEISGWLLFLFPLSSGLYSVWFFLSPSDLEIPITGDNLQLFAQWPGLWMAARLERTLFW